MLNARTKNHDNQSLKFYALNVSEQTSSEDSAPSTVTSAQGRPSKWLAPSNVVAFAVLAAMPVKLLASRLDDPDLWWHLKTGQLIARTHHIPAVDPFSFTAAGKHWVVQEWGSELFLYWIHRFAGLYGILAFRAVTVLLIYLLVARLLSHRLGTGMVTWALLALVAFAGSPNWTERPNLLSFLLFVIVLGLLERKGRALWFFVPLAALWSNLHGMVVLGLGLVVLVAITEWLKIAFHWEGADRNHAKRLAIISVASIGASFLNPYGPGLFVHAFRLISLVQSFVGEWHSPNFHSPGPIILLILLCITIAAFAFSPEKKDPTDVALVLAFTALALQAARNLAVSGIVLGLVCARYLPTAIAAIPRRWTPKKDIEGTSSVLLGLMGVLLVVVGLGTVLASGFPRSTRPKDILDDSFPIAAIKALDRPGVRVFSYDGWSGLVIYNDCGPVARIDTGCEHARVFIDLRWDFYGARLSKEYGQVFDAEPQWSTDLDRVCTTHVLVPPSAPIAQVLALDSSWQEIQKDKLSVTYRRVEPAPGCERYPIPS